jgi:hypothetical protein
VLAGDGLAWRAHEPACLQRGGLMRRRFSSATPPTFLSPSISKVLVKIGSGEDSDWDIPAAALLRQTRMALLEALVDSKRFHNKLKGVALDDCKVSLLRGVGLEPTAAEEAGAIELRSALSMVEALQAAGGLQAGQPAGDTLFIRVRLPGAPPPSGESYVLGPCTAAVAPRSVASHVLPCASVPYSLPLRSTRCCGSVPAIPRGPGHPRACVGGHGPSGASRGDGCWRAARGSGALAAAAEAGGDTAGC